MAALGSDAPLVCVRRRQMLYRKLGTKLVVGMPFKDIATSDSIFMREVGVQLYSLPQAPRPLTL